MSRLLTPQFPLNQSQEAPAARSSSNAVNFQTQIVNVEAVGAWHSGSGDTYVTLIQIRSLSLKHCYRCCQP